MSNRTLFAVTDFRADTGGIARYNTTFARTLERLDGPVDVLSLEEFGRPHSDLPRVHHKFSLAKAIRKHLLEQRPDRFIVGHIGMWPLIPMARGLMPQLPIWLIVHGIDVWDPPRAAPRVATRELQRVLAVSEYTKRRFAENYRFEPQKVGLLPGNPFVVEPAAPESFEAGEPFGLTVCRFEPSEKYKGIETLLFALCQTPSYRWYFVGGGSDLPRLRRMATELKIADRVTFTGRVSNGELEGYYKRCRLFAMPSAKEGLGLVYLEAMARGKPCIAANAGGAAEVVSPDETGSLITYGNVAELTAALHHWWAPQNAVRGGNAGRSRYENLFGHKAFSQRLEQILKIGV